MRHGFAVYNQSRSGACRAKAFRPSHNSSRLIQVEGVESRGAHMSGNVRQLRARTSSLKAVQTEQGSQQGIDMQERIEFLKEDLKHLFDDQGVDKSQYDDKVNFMDPITKYNSVSGYMFNIKMLKFIFAPEFQLHDIRKTDELEVTTRWTMKMFPTFNKVLGMKKLWDPKLYFTGVSIMGVNPETGKFNKHIDKWDALAPENQEFLSREGVSHVFSQLTSSTQTPDLDTPDYTLLKKKKIYEIRRYEAFVVAETSIPSTSSSSPEGEGGSAFNTLAGYLFGKNKSDEKMSMTTPVFTDSQGKMQFVIKARKDALDRIPEPLSNDISTRDEPGGSYGVIVFNGDAKEDLTHSKLDSLRQSLEKDNVKFDASKWILARYNDPSTKPGKRRNEILIPLQDFDIWST